MIAHTRETSRSFLDDEIAGMTNQMICSVKRYIEQIVF